MLSQEDSYRSSFLRGSAHLQPFNYFPWPLPHPTLSLVEPQQRHAWMAIYSAEKEFLSSRRSMWDFTIRLNPFNNLFSRTHHSPARSMDWVARRKGPSAQRALGAGQRGVWTFQASMFSSAHALETWRHRHVLSSMSFFSCSKEQQQMHKWSPSLCSPSFCYTETLETSYSLGPTCKSLTLQLFWGKVIFIGYAGP